MKSQNAILKCAYDLHSASPQRSGQNAQRLYQDASIYAIIYTRSLLIYANYMELPILTIQNTQEKQYAAKGNDLRRRSEILPIKIRLRAVKDLKTLQREAPRAER